MSSDKTYVPFSQRNGFSDVPPQLNIGEISEDMRRQFEYYVRLEIERNEIQGNSGSLFHGAWERVSSDLHVLFFGRSSGTYKNRSHECKDLLENFFVRGSIAQVYDLIEFLVRHNGCSKELARDLTEVFKNCRSAYRLIDNEIVAIGAKEQGEAFEAAVTSAGINGFIAARKHLLAAGSELRNGSWSSSVRESIHAVESAAVKLSPASGTLGSALSKIERNGHIHGSLKAAFSQLYGYTNDQEGVRHALVFGEEANVDEADALFMLGACASFVSYLVARHEDLSA